MEHKKDNLISSETPVSKNTFIFQLFEKDNYLIFSYKKAEKIVAALYLVTNLLSDSEPIKWQLRDRGLRMIGHILSLKNGSQSKTELASAIFSETIGALSFLEILHTAGLITEMNFSILNRELENLLDSIESKVQTSGVKNLEHTFFSIPRDAFVSKEDEKSSVSEKDVVSRHDLSVTSWTDVSRLEESYKRHYKGHSIKDEIPVRHPVSSLTAVTGKMNKGHQNVSGSAEKRKTIIIEMLKDKNNLTVKDFSLIIKDCSEKTIQRELLKLVQLSVLKKEGERRWSRYSIVSQVAR